MNKFKKIIGEAFKLGFVLDERIYCWFESSIDYPICMGEFIHLVHLSNEGSKDCFVYMSRFPPPPSFTTTHSNIIYNRDQDKAIVELKKFAEEIL